MLELFDAGKYSFYINFSYYAVFIGIGLLTFWIYYDEKKQRQKLDAMDSEK